MHVPRAHAARRRVAARVMATVAGLLLLLSLPASAIAHAAIETATPADGAVLTEPPTEIVITYTEGLTDGSSIVLKDAAGATIATGTPAAAGVLEMRVTFAPLAPGDYTIESTTRSAVDGDVDRQTLTFTIAEPTPPPATATTVPSEAPSDAPSEAASAGPTEEASPTPAPTPAPGAGGDGDDTAVLVPIAIVGLLVGVGLALVLRRRPAA